MKPLIDGDVLVYEVGFATQSVKEDGELFIRPFDEVIDTLEKKLAIILDAVEALTPPTIYLTNNTETHRMALQAGYDIGEYKPNFREEIAVTKHYKGNRESSKPVHYYNIIAYLLSAYDCCVANGYEADDAMAYDQTISEVETIICSRDKDLMQVPGWHYSWECHLQEEIHPFISEGLGYLKLEGKKLIGHGPRFFYAQTITGDVVDNIPGLPKGGPALAYKTLSGCVSEREMYEAVKSLYEEKVGEDYLQYMKEQFNLLWMIREFKDNEPVWYKPPNK